MGIVGRQRASVLVLLVLASALGASAGVMDGLSQLWTDTVREAAEDVVRLIKVKTEMELSLSSVPLDTLQHLVGLEVEGVQYNVMQDLPYTEQPELLPATKLHQLPASGLVPLEWHQQQEQRLSLPEVTLAGPLELWLTKPAAVNVFAPLATDTGVVSCVVLTEGVTVRIQGMKDVALRRPMSLPRLPAQYVAEVMAHAKLGVAEDGYENAPGILYLSRELKAAAVNTSVGRHLLSLEVQPASAVGLTIFSVQADIADLHQGPPPKLKVRKLQGGVLELSVRSGQVAPAVSSHAGSSLRRQVAQLQALARPSAWPMPYMDMSVWGPYETMLRNVLTSHPLDVDKIQRRGVKLRLIKSAISSVSMLSFDMEVRTQLPAGSARRQSDMGIPDDEGTTQIWEVVLKVDAADSDDDTKASGTKGPGVGGTGLSFTPLRVNLKEQHENTLSLSRGAIKGMLYGEQANFTTPYGFEEIELGIAGNAH